jgi:hypothetical protein
MGAGHNLDLVWALSLILVGTTSLFLVA